MYEIGKVLLYFIKIIYRKDLKDKFKEWFVRRGGGNIFILSFFKFLSLINICKVFENKFLDLFLCFLKVRI